MRNGHYLIDLHCHILPGMDDGPQTEEDFWSMAQLADAEGIDYIVATPHHRTEHYDNEREQILAAVAYCNSLLSDSELDVRILGGQECRVYPDMAEGLTAGELMAVNGATYQLVEFPSGDVPDYAFQLIYNLHMEGITPVIVHPERNQAIQKDPEILRALIINGAVGQLTAGALTNSFGRRVRKFAELLIEHHLVHLIASDAHDVTRRPFQLKAGYQQIRTLYGEELETAFLARAEDVLVGSGFYQDPPVTPGKRFGLPFRRG